MTGTTKTRQGERTDVKRVEMVSIYRDKHDIPYKKILKKREELISIHTVFSVVALLRDVSQEGVGIKFQGQQIMAGNLLRPGENYVVKLTLMMASPPSEISSFMKREGNYYFLLLKLTCRWHEGGDSVSTAGFEIRPSNPPEVLDFLSEHFNLGA